MRSLLYFFRSCERFSLQQAWTEWAEFNIPPSTHFRRQVSEFISHSSRLHSHVWQRIACQSTVTGDDRWGRPICRLGSEKSFVRWRRSTPVTGMHHCACHRPPLSRLTYRAAWDGPGPYRGPWTDHGGIWWRRRQLDRWLSLGLDVGRTLAGCIIRARSLCPSFICSLLATPPPPSQPILRVTWATHAASFYKLAFHDADT